MSEDDLRAFEPIPAAHAYCAFVAWLALYGSDEELAGAFSVNFAAWDANCARMGAALRQRYGLAPEALAFFDLFAAAPAEKPALAAIDGALERGLSAGEKIPH